MANFTYLNKITRSNYYKRYSAGRIALFCALGLHLIGLWWLWQFWPAGQFHTVGRGKPGAVPIIVQLALPAVEPSTPAEQNSALRSVPPTRAATNKHERRTAQRPISHSASNPALPGAQGMYVQPERLDSDASRVTVNPIDTGNGQIENAKPSVSDSNTAFGNATQAALLKLRVDRSLTQAATLQIGTPRKRTVSEKLAADTAEAAVPDCLRPEAQKVLGAAGGLGLIALPLLLDAKLSGKCK